MYTNEKLDFLQISLTRENLKINEIILYFSKLKKMFSPQKEVI